MSTNGRGRLAILVEGHGVLSGDDAGEVKVTVSTSESLESNWPLLER